MPQRHTRSKFAIRGLLVFMAVLPLSMSAQPAAQTRPEPVDFTPSNDIRVVKDVIYGSYGARQLQLDLYLPKQPAEDLVPGVIVIRGGGWRQGDKEGFAHIAGYLAAEGLAAASIEYRVPPEATFPAAIYDIKAAVRWMRANGEEYAINTEQIGAIGGSAGAQLVALLGASHDVSSLEGDGGRQDDLGEDRPLAELKLPPAFGFHHDCRTRHVRRHQVRRELNARKAQLQRLGERANEQGLAQPRHTLQQSVAVGEQARQHPVDDLLVPDDHLLDLLLRVDVIVTELRRGGFNLG